jgi:hypothetical protein
MIPATKRRRTPTTLKQALLDANAEAIRACWPRVKHERRMSLVAPRGDPTGSLTTPLLFMLERFVTEPDNLAVVEALRLILDLHVQPIQLLRYQLKEGLQRFGPWLETPRFLREVLMHLRWPRVHKGPFLEVVQSWYELVDATVEARSAMAIAEWVLAERIDADVRPAICTYILEALVSFRGVETLQHALPTLLRFGADLHVRTYRVRSTLLDLARYPAHLNTNDAMMQTQMETLLDAGLDPWIQDGSGRTLADKLRERAECAFVVPPSQHPRQRAVEVARQYHAERVRRAQLQLQCLEPRMRRIGAPAERSLALAMALHPRLGGSAAVGALGGDLLALIVGHAFAHIACPVADPLPYGCIAVSSLNPD